MFSHWICYIGHYLNILLLGRKSYIANITKILDEGILDEFIYIANK
jgi:hypothetical protein